MKRFELSKKTILFVSMLLLSSINNSVIGGGNNFVINDSKDGGDDDPWKGKDKGVHQNISIFYKSSTITVINAISGSDITATIIDSNNNVLQSEVIAAEDTSYFTIYVGNLPTGTYQLVLSIDGVDYLFWPFAI